MQRTYIITRGQQYDRGGASVDHGRNGGLTARYRADGSYDCGSPPAVADADAVEAAVARVIATGDAETLTLGVDAPSYTPEQVARMRRADARMREWERTDV